MAAARGTLYRVEIIEEVRRQLRCLPEPKIAEVSKLEVVRALAADIEELQKAGHTIETIALTLSRLGVQLTKATLKTYLGKLRPVGHRGRGRRQQGSDRRAAPSAKASGRRGAAERSLAAVNGVQREEPGGDEGAVCSSGGVRPSLSSDGKKEIRSVTSQQMATNRRGASTTPTVGGVHAAAAAARAMTEAADDQQTRHAPPATTHESIEEQARKEIAQERSPQAVLRGVGTATPNERAAWTFVPRQDSNDI